MIKKIDFFKIGYVACATFFIIGLGMSLNWSYNSRLFGIFICLLSIVGAYVIYRKTLLNMVADKQFEVNLSRIFLGLLLIFFTLTYNYLTIDPFGPFDFGMIISGLVIMLINLVHFKLLNLSNKAIIFTSYFLFITMFLYGFLFSGISLILGNQDYNPFFAIITKSVSAISAWALNFIEPTTYHKNVVNFNGFIVSIGDPCSGVESISIFLSAIIAYMISINSKDYKKMIIFIITGICMLYIINIVRVMTIIVSGYYFGMDVFYFVHRHLGWIFFIIGMGFYWYLLISSFESKKKEEE